MTESQTPATSQAPAASQAAAQPILKPHNNTVVPHAIADYDTDLVQLNVWTGTKWINIFDGNDFTNTQADLHRVAKVVETHTSEIQDATKTASDAVNAVDSAVSASKVNSDAIAAQSSAISEAKIALDSATTEIQQTASNAASDAANIRADVAKVESEVASAKSANQDSVNALQSDIDTTKKDLAGVQSGLSSAQAAIGQNQNLINDSVAKINNDIAQDRKDLTAAQLANSDTATQLSNYAKQAADQGKTIKILQDDDSSTKATIADINGNVSQVQDSVSGLSASLKDTQGNLATVKSLADSLNATITDQGKNITTLQATAQSLSSTLSDADGRLSKVEQTAQGHTSTLSDIQGNLSQVKQTADGLTDTLKDAQGNISQLQQTAKGTAEQISDIQGDITTLQTDVTGVKATIADNENDIHTLQANAKSLTDDMTDVKGNISNLQKTSTSLTSEMQDHDGRLSKVEQTANGTQQTVADQQGQINTIKTDATSIHETLTGQGNQIANINVTLSGLNTKYEGVSGDLGKLSDKITTNSTQITQNKQAIALKADQSTVDNLSGEVSQNTAQLKVQADQISSKVSSTDFKTLNDKVNGIQIGGRNLLLGTSTTEKSGRSYYFAQYSIAGGLKPGTTYTISGRAHVDQKAIDNAQHVFVCAYSNDWKWSVWLNFTGALTPQYAKTTFTTPFSSNFSPYVTIYLSHPNNDNSQDSISGQGFISRLKLEEGNVSTDWTPAPEDTITAIQKNSTAIDQTNQKISLKADQTEVDQVKQTASQNSSRLDVMAGQISSKVTSTDVNNIVNGKGYTTTSTVQSLINQKAGQISQTIADVKTTVDGNGNAISTANDKISNLTQTIDGIQTTVKDKADQSQITQLSNALQVKLSGSIIAQATDVTLTYTGEENEYPPAAPLVGINDVDKGSTLILSFDYVASADTKLTPQLDGDPWVPWGTLVNAIPAAKGEKGSYSKTITVNDDSWQKGNAKNLCIRCDGFKGTIEITNLVLKYADTVHDVQSTFDMLRDDINLRVTKGDLISQINLEAGGDGLISVQNGKGKLMLDAGSVVFGNEAFIPSAAITDIQADQITSGTLDVGNIRVINLTADNIHGGTLDVGNMDVKNFSANDIEAGTLSGVTIRAGDTTDFFQTSQDNIYWITDNGDQSAVLGKGTYTNFPGFNIFDNCAISLGTYAGSYLQNGTIVDRGGIAGHPKFNIEDSFANSAFDLNSELGEWGAPLDNSRISGWVGQNEYFYLEQNNGFYVRLNQDNNASEFDIQKDGCIGAYFGYGNNGNQIGLVCGDVNVTGNFHATGSKNSIVNTKQGYLAINAYETAEYYFGDIGEANTGENSQVVIGIDKIFNETINTTVPYQVFITPYSNCHVWVDQRFGNRFVIKSDKPNAQFGWELKAKRKGYENYRLRHVDGIKEKGEFKV